MRNEGSCTVLFVEDDPGLRLAVQAMLEREPWITEVVAVATGTRGLAVLETFDATILLTDARLPDISLEALLERASSMRPDMRLVVYTGLEERDTSERAGACSHAYFQKGRDPFELVRALRTSCRHRVAP